MARPDIIVGLYPDVPIARGVPQLRRSPTAAQIRALALVTSAIAGRLWQSSVNAPRWGIYNSKDERIVTPDNVMAFDNRNEARVSDFPVQQGAFASYNKVAVPYEVLLRLTKAGDLRDRAEFLTQVETVFKSLELLYIRTPERGYKNVNLIRYEVTRRGAVGAYFLTEVDVYFREVRQVPAQYSTTQAATRNAELPSAQPSVNQGIVQPEPVPTTLDVTGAF